MVVTALAVAWPVTGHGAPIVFTSAGPDAASITPTVNAFRTALGTLNADVAGSFGAGRREINWDGVPDNFAAPNQLPANFFNSNSPRGAVFSTPGSGFEVSANAINPTSTPIEFGNIDPSYPGTFSTFSPQRLFTALGSNIVDVSFFVPGTGTPALARGFGALFTDVDLPNVTSIEYFGANGGSLGTLFMAPGGITNGSLSFGGILFDTALVSRVRLTSGNAPLGPGIVDANGSPVDVVAMDDFIYGEPIPTAVPVPEPTSVLMLGVGLARLAWMRAGFRS